MNSKMLKDFNVEMWSGKTIVIYGAGEVGEQIGKGLLDKGIDNFIYCDSHKNEGTILGKKIAPVDVITSESEVIIGSSRYMIEIYKNLIAMGIEDKQIFTAREIFRVMNIFDSEHSLSLIPKHYNYERAVINLEAYINDGYVIKHLDLIITEICTLNCEACGSLMPLYHKPCNCSDKEVLEGLDLLLKSNCYIEELCLIGGEPLVNQELIQKILGIYKDSNQIATFMTISNGTLLPTEETLKMMRDNGRFFVVFSNYGELSRMQKQAADLLDEYGIESAIETNEDIETNSGRVWIDYGEVKHYDFDYEKHQNMFLRCNERIMCTTLFNGKLCLCPRIAHAVNIGLIGSDVQGSCLDLSGEQYIEASDVEKQSMCFGFLHTEEHPIACEYCNRDAGILVERAKQVPRKQH